MTPELVTLLSLVAFVAGLLVVVGSITLRLVRLHRAGIHLPRLIWRDVLVFGGLALTFVAIGFHTALGRPWDNEVWWRLATGLLAGASVWLMAYYELFVIGHRRDGRDERLLPDTRTRP